MGVCGHDAVCSIRDDEFFLDPTRITLVCGTAGFDGTQFKQLLADKFDDVSIVPTFVLTPLTYLGGVFYSISLLPTFWQNVSLFNPIVYMVNVFRHGFLGTSDIPVGWALVAIFAFIVVLFTIALWMLERGKGIRS